MQRQLRNFVFTCNNWDQSSVDKIKQLVPLFKCCYYIYGEEIGEKESTPHLQGYVELESRVVFAKIQKHLRGFHLAARLGTQQQAIEYCRKEGSYHEYGEPKVQGHRTDIDSIKSVFESDTSMVNLLKNESIQLNSSTFRMAERLVKYYDKPRDYKPHVTWLYGPPGCGKTFIATQTLPHAYFKPSGTGRWWPNYDGEEDVIIDDIRASDIDLKKLLSLLDRYASCVEDKGTTRQFKGRRIIVTAPSRPEDQYYEYGTPIYGQTENLGQLTRRIDEIREVKDIVFPDES